MQIWKVHLCNQQLASSFLLKDGWIRHQSRSAHSAAKQNWCFLKIKIKSQSLNLFNRMTWGNLFWATCWLTSIRTRRSGAGKQKMFQFVFYQGGGGDLSLLMWLRGRVWAFFSQRFPTTGSKVTAETRHRVCPSPAASVHSHGGQMSVKHVSLLFYSLTGSSVSSASLDLGCVVLLLWI